MSARLGWTLYIVSVLKSPSVPHTGARDIILYIYILEHVERMSALFASVLCVFRGVQKAGKRMALPTGILAGLSCSMPSFADFNAALQTYCHDMAFFCVFCFFLGGVSTLRRLCGGIPMHGALLCMHRPFQKQRSGGRRRQSLTS